MWPTALPSRPRSRPYIMASFGLYNRDNDVIQILFLPSAVDTVDVLMAVLRLVWDLGVGILLVEVVTPTRCEVVVLVLGDVVVLVLCEVVLRETVVIVLRVVVMLVLRRVVVLVVVGVVVRTVAIVTS